MHSTLVGPWFSQKWAKESYSERARGMEVSPSAYMFMAKISGASVVCDGNETVEARRTVPLEDAARPRCVGKRALRNSTYYEVHAVIGPQVYTIMIAMPMCTRPVLVFCDGKVGVVGREMCRVIEVGE